MVVCVNAAGSFGFWSEHLSYPEAGHLLRVPYVPLAATTTSAFVGGGTVEATQRAGIDAWPRVLAFLGAILRRN